jgi:hypothetical protein
MASEDLKAHAPSKINPLAPGAACVAHSRIDCFDCSQVQLVQQFPSTARWVNGEYIPCAVNQPRKLSDQSAHSIGQKEHISTGNGLNGSARG